LCGFVVVFAGLRLAASLNNIHEGLPVMAAHAAPVALADADGDARRGPAATPVMYDLRIAVRTASLTPDPVNVTALVADRSSPLVAAPLLPTVPPDQDVSASAAAEPAEPTDTVAEISPKQPGATDFAPETPKVEGTVLAAIDPQAALHDNATEPAHDNAAIDTTAETTPEEAPAPATVQAVADSSPVVAADTAPVTVPTAVAPARKPPVVKAPARRATVRKKRTRVAHRTAAPVSSFDATSSAVFGLLPTPSQ
jgi:hypothetical protein